MTREEILRGQRPADPMHFQRPTPAEYEARIRELEHTVEGLLADLRHAREDQK